MPFFGIKSTLELSTCREDIQSIMYEAINIIDFSVLEGHRSEKEQNEYFMSGSSKLQWPKSKHNSLPSGAIDIIPYPIDWYNLQRFEELSIVIKAVAEGQGVILDWGYDLWKWDMPHWQVRLI